MGICERNEPFPNYTGMLAWRLQQVQVEWAQLPPGPLLQRFCRFMRIVGHMLEDSGHLAEVMGEEIDYTSRQEGEEPDETGHMQAPGFPQNSWLGSGGEVRRRELPSQKIPRCRTKNLIKNTGTRQRL